MAPQDAKDEKAKKAKKKGFPVLGLLLLVGAGIGAHFGLQKRQKKPSAPGK